MTAEISTEARWRNYQHLIWTQQQINLQIQQQQLQSSTKGIGEGRQPDIPVMPANNSNAGQAQATQNNNNEGDKRVDEKTKEMIDPWDTLDAHCAFLGPTLWDKRLPYDGPDFKLEYMELEDFLTENGIPVDPPTSEAFPMGAKNGPGQPQPPRDLGHATSGGAEGGVINNINNAPLFSTSSQFLAGPSRAGGGVNHHQQSHHAGSGVSQMRAMMNEGGSHSNSRDHHHIKKHHSSRSPSPTGSSRSSSSSSQDQDMSFTHSPDSTQSSAEMVLHSSIFPGHDFDPRTRAFTDDELKPQPMIKKSKKQLVPDEQKDAKYWSRRRKNNMAAKRSRDARRVKENQIAMRAGFLEKENQAFKDQLEQIRDELKRSNNEIFLLKEQLSHCHREH